MNATTSRPTGGMRGLRALCALLAALTVCLTGCAATQQEQDSAAELSLPIPSEEPENMILGETLTNSFNNVTLYYVASDGTGFSTVTRSVRTEAGQSLPEAAAAALMNSGGEGLRALGDAKVLSCEYACGTATVNLSIDARNVQNPQELLALECAIGNTLLGINGVNGVNVLIGDLSEGFFQLPLGVQTEPVASVAAAYAQLQAERDRQSQQDSAPIPRSALLYFPTAGGDWLVPELRSLSAQSGDFVTALIDALKSGPLQESCAISSIPEGVELLESRPVVRTLASGERALDLNFSSTLANYLAFSGLEVWQLCGSVSLTMGSFLPELDAVRIMVNGDPITMCELGSDILRFPDGLIRRRDFSGRIGSVATLYLEGASGGLEPVGAAVSMRSALSPRSLLTELFDRAGEGDAPRLPLPVGASPEDLLGVQTSGGIARINLSGSFYRACQTLDPRQERNLVYAMVNTLCQLSTVRAVRFYVEGLSADTLAGTIYLKSPLIPNPGIVVRSPNEEDRP